MAISIVKNWLHQTASLDEEQLIITSSDFINNFELIDAIFKILDEAKHEVCKCFPAFAFVANHFL